eukprot:TRINITY_DN9088_c0_g1_i1.p1 TRINITY_DN9088_c0_g1~~TRINITY_DN9088_c0_g1_i1.p1  ORF type:complete len:380 (+),score=75.80 TRINITY_DN9088_c0_g1_i1:74-1141(+)
MSNVNGQYGASSSSSLVPSSIIYQLNSGFDVINYWRSLTIIPPKQSISMNVNMICPCNCTPNTDTCRWITIKDECSKQCGGGILLNSSYQCFCPTLPLNSYDNSYCQNIPLPPPTTCNNVPCEPSCPTTSMIAYNGNECFSSGRPNIQNPQMCRGVDTDGDGILNTGGYMYAITAWRKDNPQFFMTYGTSDDNCSQTFGNHAVWFEDFSGLDISFPKGWGSEFWIWAPFDSSSSNTTPTPTSASVYVPPPSGIWVEYNDPNTGQRVGHLTGKIMPRLPFIAGDPNSVNYFDPLNPSGDFKYCYNETSNALLESGNCTKSTKDVYYILDLWFTLTNRSNVGTHFTMFDCPPNITSY